MSEFGITTRLVMYSLEQNIMISKLIVTLAALIPASSMASWAQIGDTPQSSHYIDRSTLRQSGNYIEIWWLMNLKPHMIPQVGFSSVVGYEKIDCKGNKSTTLRKTSFAQPNGQGVGSPNPPSKTWEIPSPGGLQYNLMRTLCSR